MKWKKETRLFIFLIFFSLVSVFPGYGMCQELFINNQGNFFKDIINFQISINSAPNTIHAFGFDLYFDPEILEYEKYAKGNLLGQYELFDCIQLEPGKLRCGGINTGEGTILKGQGGNIINLSFRKIECQKTTLCINNLVDDIENWEAEKGQFFCINKKRER